MRLVVILGELPLHHLGKPGNLWPDCDRHWPGDTTTSGLVHLAVCGGVLVALLAVEEGEGGLAML